MIHSYPAVTPASSLQGSGSSLPNNPIMSRDNYFDGYALNRNAYPSPTASMSDYPRFTYSTSMPQGLGNHMDPANSMFTYVQPQRSGQLQLDAPPFGETESIHPIIVNNTKITPVIQARIHKGFFQADEKWTCYRRNYFSVSCSFTLQPWMANATYYIETSQGQRMEHISSFAMSISAVVNASESETRELVQHTPKRDKQSERKPERVVLRPQQPYYLGSNVAGPGSQPSVYSVANTMDYSPYAMQSAQPPTQHTFERIQFQKATANNGKRRAQQQYYNLVVELLAKVNRPEGHSQWLKVAKRLSDPMVVRGRSPGHYKDGRRDSSASMGDSGGNGNPGDVARGVLSSSIDHSPFSQVQFMYDSSQRGDTHYNNSRDVSRHQDHQQQQQQYGQINHSAEISPLVSTSDASLDFIFPDTFGSHQSADGGISHRSRFHGNNEGDGNPLRRGSGSTGSSSQSHVPSLDLSSSSGTLDDANNPHSLNETFDPMIPSYQSEQEDESSPYSKQANTERCPLASIVNDSSQCSRNGGASSSSFSRFIDPIQESLCA